MKKRFSVLLCALLLLLSAIPAQALTGEGTRAADVLATLNIVRGAYNVDDIATRAQAVSILVRLSGQEAAAARAPRSPFIDLPDWAKNSVNYAYAQGWATGTAGHEFGSNTAIDANTYCAFLLRMLGYSSDDFSADRAAVFARHMGITSRNYTGDLSRGDLFELSAGALTATYKNSEDTVISRLVASGTASSAAANALGLTGGAMTARQVADRCTAAVFQMESYDTRKEINENTPSGSSSGFFISADGMAITNYHAIDQSIKAVVTLSSGEKYPVERVLFYDAEIDIAVLRISTTSVDKHTTPGFPYLPIASRDTLRAGDEIYTIGNPLGLGLAISDGIISDVSREVEGYGLPCIMSTADISQGSSGGALLNVYGQAVGVTTGAYVYGNNMYLGVPLDPVLQADLTVEGQTLEQVAKAEKGKPART